MNNKQNLEYKILLKMIRKIKKKKMEQKDKLFDSS